ncbi:MAG: lamin tail domain-containing protein [Candidatus Dojkabacteria bacterium]|nr:lamin tail domain-containing protein [Candidatus Dojkabacteria bacterium]
MTRSLFTVHKAIVALFLLLFLSSPLHASSPSILITELFYDPIGADSGNEWIELYNPTDQPVNLKDWYIEAAGTTFVHRYSFSSYFLYPHTYLLIGEPAVTSAHLIASSLSFQNGGTETDGVRLVDQSGITMDTVLYDSPNTNQLPDNSGNTGSILASDIPEGHSLSRTNLEPSETQADFVDTAEPTPGSANVFLPTAIFEIPETAFINHAITLDASPSHDIDGDIQSFEWAIDGTTLSATLSGEYTQYSFENTGTFTITLTVTDSAGLQNTTSSDIKITEDPDNPVISSISSIKTLPEGTSVTISGVIISPPGIPTEGETYLHDGSAGIRVRPQKDQSLEYGHTYRISGILDTAYGELRVSIHKTVEQSEDISVPPISPTAGTQLTDLLGSIVSVTLEIEKKRDHYLYPTKDSTLPFPIYLPDSFDIELPNPITGTALSVTGIVSRYGTNTDGSPKIRIIPRFESDISIPQSSVLAWTGYRTVYPVMLLGILIYTTVFVLTAQNTTCKPIPVVNTQGRISRHTE